MNPTTGSASTTTSSATYAAQTSFAAAPADEFHRALMHVRQGPRYRPVGDHHYLPVDTPWPVVSLSSDPDRYATLTSPGTSPYHIRCFAFQTLCDIARETREIASLVPSTERGPYADIVTCASLGRALEDRMRNIYGISDFSISNFSRETGLASLCAAPDPWLRVGSTAAYDYDLHALTNNTGLVFHALASGSSGRGVDYSHITEFGRNFLAQTEGVPVIDIIHAFHIHLTSGAPEPSLLNINGHLHRQICRSYSAHLAARSASSSSRR